MKKDDEDDEDDDEFDLDLDLDFDAEECDLDPELTKEFDQLQTILEEREPTLVKILNAKIPLKRKSNVLELYEIYKTLEFPSKEALDMKMTIKEIVKRYETEETERHLVLSPDSIEKMLDIKTVLNKARPKLSIKDRILVLNSNADNKAVLYNKYKESIMDCESDSNGKLTNWINSALSLPHDNLKQCFNTFPDKVTESLRHVKKILDEELYGMEKTKEQLLLFLNSKLRNDNSKGCALGLLGPPGVGKTAICKALAKALEYPFEQLSFGSVARQEMLIGHEYTYIGSKPGMISEGLQRMKYKNGIMLFDEFDKIKEKRDVVSCLLHILDFTQNNDFKDAYFSELSIDLSHIWFICSMNSIPEDPALRDRIQIIDVEGYSAKDKANIMIHHIFPNIQKNIGLQPNSINISDQVARHLINRTDLPSNKGVRTIEAVSKTLIEKIYYIVTNKENEDIRHLSFYIKDVTEFPLNITPEMIDKLIPIPVDAYSHLNMYS
jgi:ATP-dependent Lon protease